MGENSKIEWTHHTFNPWRGCTKISKGCEQCYAADLSKRNPATLGIWGPRGSRAPAAESYWRQLAKWDREAKAAGERRRVFVASLADIGERDETMPAESRPIVAAARTRLWHAIQACDGLDFLLLTKRPDHLAELLAARWPNGIPPNIWAGTSVEDQAAADERIPHLLNIPARVRFLSCEPLLGPVDLTPWLRCGGSRPSLDESGYRMLPGSPPVALIQWTIVGGESGAHARPMHPSWARSLRDQCVAAGVPFHFKQWGEWVDYRQVGATAWHRTNACGVPPKGALTQNCEPIFGGKSFPSQSLGGDMSAFLVRVGKHAAGRLLDGQTWDEVPR